jgi:hypothetical protein
MALLRTAFVTNISRHLASMTKPAPMHAPQILVVDDDLEIRKLLARYLKEQGFYLCSTILKGLLTLNLNLCEII